MVTTNILEPRTEEEIRFHLEPHTQASFWIKERYESEYIDYLIKDMLGPLDERSDLQREALVAAKEYILTINEDAGAVDNHCFSSEISVFMFAYIKGKTGKEDYT